MFLIPFSITLPRQDWDAAPGKSCAEAAGGTVSPGGCTELLEDQISQPSFWEQAAEKAGFGVAISEIPLTAPRGADRPFIPQLTE